MADDPPKLKLAAEADPIELEKQQALRALAWPTREMAANLLRVMRGAGKPALLPQQIIDLSDAILAVKVRAWGVWAAMEETLQSAVPGGLDSSWVEECDGTIVQGALQLAASRLLRQRAQEAAGSREITDGIRDLERHEEREREKYRVEAAAFRQQPRKPAKAKRRSVNPKPPKAAPAVKAAPASTAADAPVEKPASTAEFMMARKEQLRGDDPDRQ